jgi:hypothetical protein
MHCRIDVIDDQVLYYTLPEKGYPGADPARVRLDVPRAANFQGLDDVSEESRKGGLPSGISERRQGPVAA